MTAGANTAAPAGLVIAPEDPQFYRDPDPACRWLHEYAPIYWHGAQELWILSKWEDIRFASRNPSLFASGGGVLVPRRAVHRNGRGGRRPPSLQEMDPPEHGLYRQLVSRAFSPRMVASLEHRIRRIATDCLDRVEPGAVTDFVSQVAAPVPLLIIAEMLGVPQEDRGTFKRWTDAVALSTNTDASVGREMAAYFAVQLKEREREPQDDLLSALLLAEVDGERLTEAEIVQTVAFILVAGNETTRNLISGGARALMQFPDQRTRLLEDPSLMTGAVEEMLRWVTPVQWFARTVTGDVELNGVSISAGDYVLLFYRAGNRDPEVWSDPYKFDVTRPLKAHTAFGHGEHSCIGAPLARLEAKVVFEELLSRYPNFSLADDVELLPSALLNAVERMPVEFRP